MVVLVGLAIDQIAQSGLSSLSVIYYSAQLFRIGKGLSETSSQPFLQYETWPMSLFIVIVT
ncbi:hypothetical protein CJP08_28055 [Klebsiella pneumoniae]|nr:hypothetical protein CJP08_28055 [Klebsiella pneumoniae]